MEDKMEKYVREVLGVKRTNNSQIGHAPDNSMAHQSGLDAIDREAMKQGFAEGQLRGMTPRR